MTTLSMKLACKEIKKHDKTGTKAEYFEFLFKGIGTSTGAKLTLQGQSADDYHIDDILAAELNTMVVPRQAKLGI